MLFCWSYCPAGYGWCHLPTTPGEHALDIVAFRPRGSVYDDVVAYFVGGTPRYEDPSVITTTASREGHLVKSVGMVRIEMQVIHRNFGSNLVFASTDT